MFKKPANSFFEPFNPFQRKSHMVRYACSGLKPICSDCPSFLSAADIEEVNAGSWLPDGDEIQKIKDATGEHNYLVASSFDLYSSDVPSDLRLYLRQEMAGQPEQTFFVCSKNTLKMAQEWGNFSNIVWGFSASTQEELYFHETILKTVVEDTGIVPDRLALHLTPLVEPVVLPESFEHLFDYIFVDGFYGDNAKPFHMEWVLALKEHLSESGQHTKLILEGIGDAPFYKGQKVSTRRKKFHPYSIAQVLKKLSLN